MFSISDDGIQLLPTNPGLDTNHAEAVRGGWFVMPPIWSASQFWCMPLSKLLTSFRHISYEKAADGQIRDIACVSTYCSPSVIGPKFPCRNSQLDFSSDQGICFSPASVSSMSHAVFPRLMEFSMDCQDLTKGQYSCWHKKQTGTVAQEIN